MFIILNPPSPDSPFRGSVPQRLPLSSSPHDGYGKTYSADVSLIVEFRGEVGVRELSQRMQSHGSYGKL